MNTVEDDIMNGRQSKQIHHQVYGNRFSINKRKSAKVSFITDHTKFRRKVIKPGERAQPAEIIVLKAGEGIDGPRLPKSIIVGAHKEEQIPYIEGLGWMLVYLFKRYPDLKATNGFVNEHIKCTDHSLRTGFYETHAFFTLDVTDEKMKHEHTITLDITHGRFDDSTSSWTIELFEGGCFVEKYICETPDQLVVKLVAQLNKHGLIRQAWQRLH